MFFAIVFFFIFVLMLFLKGRFLDIRYKGHGIELTAAGLSFYIMVFFVKAGLRLTGLRSGLSVSDDRAMSALIGWGTILLFSGLLLGAVFYFREWLKKRD